MGPDGLYLRGAHGEYLLWIAAVGEDRTWLRPSFEWLRCDVMTGCVPKRRQLICFPSSAAAEWMLLHLLLVRLHFAVQPLLFTFSAAAPQPLSSHS